MVGSIDQRTGRAIDGSNIRVLVDIEARSDGGVRAVRLHTERLTPIRYDDALLALLDKEAQRCLLEGSLASRSAWDALLTASRDHVINSVNRLLQPFWPGNYHKPRNVPVELSFRLLNLDPNRENIDSDLQWLEVVELDEAIAKTAGRLQPSDVEAELYRSLLSLEAGANAFVWAFEHLSRLWWRK
ncbi:hypothetical protein ACE0DR_28010 [Azotobacter sp. CWF10]